jgi:hypothetical protein
VTVRRIESCESVAVEVSIICVGAKTTTSRDRRRQCTYLGRLDKTDKNFEVWSGNTEEAGLHVGSTVQMGKLCFELHYLHSDFSKNKQNCKYGDYTYRLLQLKFLIINPYKVLRATHTLICPGTSTPSHPRTARHGLADRQTD